MQAVLFDLWETLITDAPELQRARQLWRAANVHTVLDAAGLTSDTNVIDRALGATLHALSLKHDAGTDTDARGRLHLFLAEYEKLGGVLPGERTHQMLEEAICTMPEGLYPRRMPAAVETLSAIRARGLKTGLISNAGITTAPTLRTMLGHYELLPLLDVLVFSDEARLAKPSVVLFEDALKALGCEAAETIFVGDSPAHDVVGARAAGMQAIVIGRKEIDGITPDGRIQDLSDLLDLIPILNTA